MNRYNILKVVFLLNLMPILCFGFKPGPNRDKIPEPNQRIALLGKRTKQSVSDGDGGRFCVFCRDKLSFVSLSFRTESGEAGRM